MAVTRVLTAVSVLLGLLLPTCTQAVPTPLPGIPPAALLHTTPSYAGYLPLTGRDGIPLPPTYYASPPVVPFHPNVSQLFFWYMERLPAERGGVAPPPGERDKFVIWLNGGPGCSSLNGALQENGPFFRAGTHFTPNAATWTKAANVLFIEQPVGTGFGIAREPASYATNQLEVAEDFLEAFERFLEVFPEVLDMDMYISGESYAGKYIPFIASTMLRREVKYAPNLKHLLIAGPFLSDTQSLDPLAYDRYLRETPLIPTPYLDARGGACLNAINDTTGEPFAALECYYDLVQEYIELVGGLEGGEVGDVRGKTGREVWGGRVPGVERTRPDVQLSLHALALPQRPIRPWTLCFDPVYDILAPTDNTTSTPELTYVLDRGVNVSLFVGDLDFIVSYTSVEDQVDRLPWRGGMGLGDQPGTRAREVLEPWFLPAPPTPRGPGTASTPVTSGTAAVSPASVFRLGRAAATRSPSYVARGPFRRPVRDAVKRRRDRRDAANANGTTVAVSPSAAATAEDGDGKGRVWLFSAAGDVAVGGSSSTEASATTRSTAAATTWSASNGGWFGTATTLSTTATAVPVPPVLPPRGKSQHGLVARARGLSLYRVFEAGHMVPMDAPFAALGVLLEAMYPGREVLDVAGMWQAGLELPLANGVEAEDEEEAAARAAGVVVGDGTGETGQPVSPGSSGASPAMPVAIGVSVGLLVGAAVAGVAASYYRRKMRERRGTQLGSTAAPTITVVGTTACEMERVSVTGGGEEEPGHGNGTWEEGNQGMRWSQTPTAVPVLIEDPQSKDFAFNSSLLPTTLLSDPTTARHVLATDPRSHKYEIAFRLIPSSNTLHAALLMSPANLPDKPTKAWVGIGFGGSMLDASFVVCHMAVVYPISFIPLDTIPPHRLSNLVWAVQPRSLYNTVASSWFSYHEDCSTCRGTGVVDWSAGSFSPRDVSSFQVKQAHGFGMAFVWLVMFPAMVYYARYFRSTPNWMRVHYTVQSVGIILVIAFLILIVTNHVNWKHPHAICGITLISLLLLQSTLGLSNRLKFNREGLAPLYLPVKLAHAIIGTLLLCLSALQVSLGLDILYPRHEENDRGKAIWITFYAVCAFWPAAFLLTELYFLLVLRRVPKTMRKALAALRGRGRLPGVPSKKTRGRTPEPRLLTGKTGPPTPRKARSSRSRDGRDAYREVHSDVSRWSVMSASTVGARSSYGGDDEAPGIAVGPAWVPADALARLEDYQARLGGPRDSISGSPTPSSSAYSDAAPQGSGFFVVNRGRSEPEMVSSPVAVEAPAKSGWKRFTWEDVVTEVVGGRLLVVANRRYVYDATKWADSHPGGALVLYGVAGTDISFDFFREAGFDAAEITTMPDFEPTARPLPAPNYPSDALPKGLSVPGAPPSSSGPRAHQPLPTPLQMTDLQPPILTQQDWRLMHRARRTNVHSHLAVQRLARHLVGELVDAAPPAGRAVSVSEYRRYAVTARELVSAGSGGWMDGFGGNGGPSRRSSRDSRHSTSSSLLGQLGPTGGPVFRLRLCLLFPTPEAFTDPPFAPGECVEIQARVGGQVVSRFYTPVCGSPVAFEIVFRVRPGGVMSSWLAQQKPGERQVKVRGPFGRRVFGVDRPLGRAEGPGMGMGNVPREILFIAGGTGITPCLHMVHTLFLAPHAPLRVTTAYDPTAPDELELRPGDVVSAYHHSMDGWARGINQTTGQEGVFPLTLTQPPCRPDAKLTILACVRSGADACGQDVLRAAELSYPERVQVHWVVGTKALAAAGAGGGGDAAGTGLAADASDAHLLAEMGETTLERTRRALGCGVVHRGTLEPGLLEEVWRWQRERRFKEFAEMGIETVGAGRSGVAVVAPLARGDGPLVVVCGPEAFVQVAGAVLRQATWLEPREVVTMGAERPVA
ncbi:Cell death protease [Phlyctochytrium bullatum]|nr:Cell death protease [Phlyctochytrium bullatum]